MFLFFSRHSENLKKRFKKTFPNLPLLLSILIILFSSAVFGKSISKADRKILSAAISGNLRLAQKALKQGASVHARDPRQYFLGETPLHKVAFHNDVSFVRFLLSQGADPNLSDDRGETPLITAVYGLSLESVSVLLDAKADPYLETKSGISPAVLAADLCSLPILKLLKDAGVDFNRPTKKGLLPIYTAVARCDREFLQFLVDSGSTIESPTVSGVTPLMHAIKYTNIDAIRFFMEKNVSVSSVDKHGRDALYYLLGSQQEIAAYGMDYGLHKDIYKEIALYLIRKGTPLYREYKDGKTPLFLLLGSDPPSSYYDYDLQEFFFKYCKTNQINLNKPNRFGVTPLQYFKLNREVDKNKKDPDRIRKINRMILDINQKNPSAAFHSIVLLSFRPKHMDEDPDPKINNATIRQVLVSFLSLPKLPVLEWLELYLWTTIFDFEEDKNLKNLLLNRFPEPPAGFWAFLSMSDIRNDPKLSDLWLRSIQKGNSITQFWYADHSFMKLDVRSGSEDAFLECRTDLLEKLSSQSFFWNSIRNFPRYLSSFPSCEDEKEEQKSYQLLQSVQANPGKDDWIRYSPLCREIPTEKESKDPKIRERSLRRISILLKMGASPNCYVWPHHWDDYTTPLDAARKYGLKHLEELLLSFGAEDPRKLPLQKAIVAKDKNKIQKLLDLGAVIDMEELKLAKGDPELLSYLLEEYNSLRRSPVFDTIGILKPYDDVEAEAKKNRWLLPFLLKKGFSLKVRSLEEPSVGSSCAIEKILNSDLKNIKSLLKSQNILDYSCRDNHGFTKEVNEKIKYLKLESVFPELQEYEESYLYK
ncbi:ankyrin repeat protein [Leptospira weilii str. 2006001855]|uniref:Ankyrin repeat protein n=1 Tax=Leptospira weilii str. 2006001855 TaxID=996804 RepID=M6FN20_9LEPT|nr:ankyrin repeat protein [Leptospira weilii str. 2006001855]